MSMTDPKFAELWQKVRALAVENAMVITRKAQREDFARGLDEHAATSAVVSMLEYFCWTGSRTTASPGSRRSPTTW
jgi:hypothetical protein